MGLIIFIELVYLNRKFNNKSIEIQIKMDYNLQNQMSEAHGGFADGGLYGQLHQGPSRGGGGDYMGAVEGEARYQRGYEWQTQVA